MAWLPQQIGSREEARRGGNQSLKKKQNKTGSSLGVQWLRPCLPKQGMCVQTLVCGAKIPHALRPKNQTQSKNNTVTNSMKSLKMVHTKEKQTKSLKELEKQKDACQQCVCL